MNKEKVVFISHCHTDSKIADVFRTRLESWSNFQISIFQSSHPQKAPVAGGKLKTELAKALADANVVILIYTSAERDWSYCSYECGLASDPVEQQKTRIIVIEFIDPAPKPFSDLLRIRVDQKGIKKFTWDFHKDPKFFPGLNTELVPGITEEEIENRSNDLLTELDKFVTGHREEIPRWDYIKIALESDYVETIRSEKNWKGVLSKASELISKHCIVREGFGEAPKHFGFDQIECGMQLNTLIQRWMEDSKGNLSMQWIDDVYKEIAGSIIRREAEPTWHLMKSMRKDVNWYLVPIINHVRRLSDDNSMEFDLYFYRIPIDDKGYAKIRT